MSTSKILCRPLFFSAMLVGLSLSATACKSEIDGKQAANVGPAKSDPAKPAVAAKADAPKVDAPKVDAPAQPGADPAVKADSAVAEAGTGKTGPATELKLDPANSSIGFVGAKVTGDHSGGFVTLSGKCAVTGGQLTGVTVEVETTSVTSDDVKLTGHLKSPDFFDIAKYPKSTFTSTAIKAQAGKDVTHAITGDLDLHGVKKQISFNANLTNVSDKEVKGKAEFTINRKDFNIVYPGKPDDLIKDDVLLKLNLACKS